MLVAQGESVRYFAIRKIYVGLLIKDSEVQPEAKCSRGSATASLWFLQLAVRCWEKVLDAAQAPRVPVRTSTLCDTNRVSILQLIRSQHGFNPRADFHRTP